MIRVHHLNASRSQRILWLLEEMEQPYEIVFHARAPIMAPAAMRAIHPLGKAPIIEDGATVLAESSAIIDYIVTRYDDGGLAPRRDEAEWPAYVEWLHYAEGSFAKPIGQMLLPRVFGGGYTPEMRAYAQAGLDLHLGYVTDTLAHGPFLMGKRFSAVDVMITFSLQLAIAIDILGPWPALRDYVARMEARPAYLRAVERGGPLGLDYPAA